MMPGFEQAREMAERARKAQQAMNDLHVAVDEDCPACDWPERWFSVGTGDYGCLKCEHRGRTRTT